MISAGRWLRAFVEEIQVLGVGEYAIPLLARYLVDDSEITHAFEGFGRQRRGGTTTALSRYLDDARLD